MKLIDCVLDNQTLATVAEMSVGREINLAHPERSSVRARYDGNWMDNPQYASVTMTRSDDRDYRLGNTLMLAELLASGYGLVDSEVN